MKDVDLGISTKQRNKEREKKQRDQTEIMVDICLLNIDQNCQGKPCKHNCRVRFDFKHSCIITDLNLEGWIIMSMEEHSDNTRHISIKNSELWNHLKGSASERDTDPSSNSDSDREPPSSGHWSENDNRYSSSSSDDEEDQNNEEDEKFNSERLTRSDNKSRIVME